MKNRIFSLLLAVVFFISSVEPVYALSKVDMVKGKSREQKIEELVKSNIIQGKGNNDLDLNANIKRSELTKIVVYSQGYEQEASLLQNTKNIFSDVDTNYWANGVINAARAMKLKNSLSLINGYPDGTFKPENYITNAEMLKIMVMLAKTDLTKDQVKNAKWPDDFVKWAKEENIIGDSTGLDNLDFNKSALRGDSFIALYNALNGNLIKKNPSNDNLKSESTHIGLRNKKSNYNKDYSDNIVKLDFSKLSSLIAEAKEIDLSDKTQESILALKKEIEKSEEISNKTNISQDLIDKQLKALSDAINGLKKKSNLSENKNPMNLRKINKDFYTAIVNQDEDYEKIRLDIGKNYPEIKEFYIAKLYRNDKKVALYIANSDYDFPKDTDKDEVIPGIYRSDDKGNLIYCEENSINDQAKITVFAGDVKLSKPYKTGQSVVGFKDNSLNGSLDLQADTKEIRGLNFKLQNTEKEALLKHAAISQTGNVNTGLSNLSIVDNTFDFGSDTIAARSAIRIISSLKSGYLIIKNNTITGMGNVKDKAYNYEAIGLASRALSGTTVEISNNKIQNYGFNAIGAALETGSKITIKDNEINNVGQNGIGVFVFGKTDDIYIEGNKISGYGTKEILRGGIGLTPAPSNEYETGISLEYINTVYGVKVNNKYYSNKEKLASDLQDLKNTVQSKEENDKNSGSLNSTPVYIGQRGKFRDPIEYINKEYTNLKNDDVIIVKDEDGDLLLPSSEKIKKTLKSLTIVGEGSGKITLSPNIEIEGDLYIDLPNASLQNNANVKGKIIIKRIKENDVSSFVLEQSKDEITLFDAPEEGISISLKDIKNKIGESISADKSKLDGNVHVYESGKLIKLSDFELDDGLDKITLKKQYLNTLEKTTEFKIEYSDASNNISSVSKSFTIKTLNNSSAKVEFASGKQESITVKFAPEAGIQIKVADLKNSKGEDISPEKSKLAGNIQVKAMFLEAANGEIEVNDSTDTITIKKEFLDKITSPAFGNTHDLKITISDPENKISQITKTLALRIIDNSSAELVAIDPLTFTQGKAPEKGISFEFKKITDTRGFTIPKNKTNLEEYLDIEAFPVDFKNEVEDYKGRIRFKRSLIDIDDENDRITFKKDYLDKLVAGSDLHTEFGVKQFTFKYRDMEYGTDYRSQKNLIHIKKALTDLDSSTKISSKVYNVDSEITSASSKLDSKTSVYNFINNIDRDNPRQVLRVYSEKFIENGKVSPENIYNYKNDYEEISSGDYLLVTAEDGKTMQAYKISFEDTSSSLIVKVNDSDIVKKLGTTFIELKEGTKLSQLQAALELKENSTLKVSNKGAEISSEDMILDGFELLITNADASQKLNIKVLGSSNYRALIVGNSDYPGEKFDLAGPVNDLIVMKKTFENQNFSGKKFTKINKIENARKEEFLQGIKDAFADAKDNDVSYLYYSGHGNYINGTSYICTVDDAASQEEQYRNWISVKELKQALDQVKGMKVLILDSCNSGGFIGKEADAVSSPTINPGRNFSNSVVRQFSLEAETRDAYLTSNNYKVLVASSQNEYSYEDKLEKIGKFTKVLSELAGIDGSIKGDANNDNKISLEEAFNYLNDNVIYTSHIQAFPRNDSYTIFELDKNIVGLSKDTKVSSKITDDKEDFNIIIQGERRMISSNGVDIDTSMTVGEFLSHIIKNNENQRLYVIPTMVEDDEKNKKSDDAKLQRLDRLLVIAENGEKATYIITVKKATAKSDNINISSKETRGQADFKIIANEYMHAIGKGIVPITDEMTVEEFISHIVKGHEKQKLKLMSKSNKEKNPTDKMANFDKLIVIAESGKEQAYNITVTKKLAGEPDFASAFSISKPFNRIESAGVDLVDTMTVGEFLSYMQNKNEFANVFINDSQTSLRKNNDDLIANGDRLVTLKDMTSFPAQYILLVKKSTTSPEGKLQEPDFGGKYTIGKIRKEIISGDSDLTSEITVEEFISSITNKAAFEEIKILKAYENNIVKQPSDKLENEDILFLKKAESQAKYKLNVKENFIIIQ